MTVIQLRIKCNCSVGLCDLNRFNPKQEQGEERKTKRKGKIIKLKAIINCGKLRSNRSGKEMVHKRQRESPRKTKVKEEKKYEEKNKKKEDRN